MLITKFRMWVGLIRAFKRKGGVADCQCSISLNYRVNRSRKLDSRSVMAEPNTIEEGQLDPVAFLSALRDACPNITSMLNSKQAKLLSKSPEEPYDPKDINEQYLTDLAAFYGVKQKQENAKLALRHQLLLPHKQYEDLDVKGFTVKIKALEKVRTKLLLQLIICSHDYGWLTTWQADYDVDVLKQHPV